MAQRHQPAISLLIWLAAGVVAFIPFAFGTSPWNAVTLRVPGNQGNRWHLLAGVPVFLAYPAIWPRLRSLLSPQLSTPLERRMVWIAVCLFAGGAVPVEALFLLHLAGTSAWQRSSVLSLGFGILVASAIVLFLRRHRISLTGRCLALSAPPISPTQLAVSSFTAWRPAASGPDSAGLFPWRLSDPCSSSLPRSFCRAFEPVRRQ